MKRIGSKLFFTRSSLWGQQLSESEKGWSDEEKLSLANQLERRTKEMKSDIEKLIVSVGETA